MQTSIQNIKAQLKTSKFLRFLKWEFYYKNRLPAAIELELDSRCNRKCVYCPVSLRPRPRQQMSLEMFQKIVDELKAINWRGTIMPHFFNEPLIDKRLKDFLQIAKGTLKDNVYTKVLTNGDLLKIDLFREWVEELKIIDRFEVSIHDDTPKKHLTALMDYAKSKSLESYLRLNDIKSEETAKFNRGGLIAINDPRIQQYLIENGCNWALKMVISASGNYLICCNDYDEGNVIDNVAKNSIRDMWFKTRDERKNLYLANFEREICKICVGIEN